MPITIILADDHPIILDGLAALLRAPEFEVLVRCSDGEQALAAVRRHRPDILVLDLQMPRLNGLQVVEALRHDRLPTRVVVLTASVEIEDLVGAVRLGVHGLVLKGMASRLLLECIRTVHSGRRWIEKEIAGRVIDGMHVAAPSAPEPGGLAPREREVAGLVAAGLANKEVARRLGLTEGTVKMHLHNVYEKLGVRDRLQLAVRARELRLA